MIPKGWPIKGLKPAKAAAREAYEEAGVRGSIKARAIGVFSYEKSQDENGIIIPCEVKVFPMLVRRQDKTWPESHQRKTNWFTPEEAVAAITEDRLKALMISFLSTVRHRRMTNRTADRLH